MQYDLTQDADVTRAYNDARAKGAPDLTSENDDFDDALSNWCASAPCVVLNTPAGMAVAYLDAGWWCAYRVAA